MMAGSGTYICGIVAGASKTSVPSARQTESFTESFLRTSLPDPLPCGASRSILRNLLWRWFEGHVSSPL